MLKNKNFAGPYKNEIANITRQDTTKLKDVYYTWANLDQPKRPGCKNQDRQPNDILNYERALRCLAAGANQGNDDLEAADAIVLRSHDPLLWRYVAEGAAVLNERREKAPPSDKTIQNLVSCCKALRTGLKDEGQSHGRSLYRIMLERPKLKYRKAFRRTEWPTSLSEDYQGYIAWKTKAILSREEGERFRRHVCRPVTMAAHTSQINRYIGYLVRERNLSLQALEDICQPELYAEFPNWYFEQDAYGGYHTASATGISLGTLSQYLVAMGRLPQKGEGDENIWDEFYALGNRALEIGAQRGELSEPADVGRWKPQDLLEIAREAWQTPTPRFQKGNEPRYQIQVFNRLRSALFFMLAYETPLRARNFVEMRWGKNLSRNAEGRYELLFRGLELKVSNRGYRTNEYRHTYSEEASTYIDRWRDHLRGRFGDDFEKQCSYVFSPSKFEDRPVDYAGFRHYIARLVLELRGETFNPHKVRHIVASYLIKETKGGHNLAAKLLGNKKETVLSTYDRPNNDEALQEYLSRRREEK